MEISRASPNSLPYELLTYIFSLACPPIDFKKRSICESEHRIFSDKHNLHHRNMPLILDAVCGYWRKVVFSSPALWSTFALEVLDGKLELQVSLLRLYLTNIGPLPFSLDVDMRLHWVLYLRKYGRFDPSTQWKEIQPLTEVIFDEFPEKIQTLRLAGALPGWMCFLSEQRLPNLQDLTFGWESRMNNTTTLALKDGVFPIHPWESTRMSWAVSTLQPGSTPPPLTTLHLRHVYIDICVEILLLCPHLIEYHCYDPAVPPTTRDSTSVFRPSICIDEPFSLPNLKRFGWTPYMGGGYDSLLENISLPNLEELQWCGNSEYDRTTEGETVVFRFFSGLPKTLHSLTYREYFGDFLHSEDHYFYRLLSHFPRAQLLVFSRCSGSFLSSTLQLLSDHTSESGSLLLPKLGRITVHRYCDREDFGAVLVKMLEIRRFHIPNFTFEVMQSDFAWAGNALEGLRKLQTEFPLTVLDESQEKIFAYFTEQELALFSQF